MFKSFGKSSKERSGVSLDMDSDRDEVLLKEVVGNDSDYFNEDSPSFLFFIFIYFFVEIWNLFEQYENRKKR